MSIALSLFQVSLLYAFAPLDWFLKYSYLEPQTRYLFNLLAFYTSPASNKLHFSHINDLFQLHIISMFADSLHMIIRDHHAPYHSAKRSLAMSIPHYWYTMVLKPKSPVALWQVLSKIESVLISSFCSAYTIGYLWRLGLMFTYFKILLE